MLVSWKRSGTDDSYRTLLINSEVVRKKDDEHMLGSFNPKCFISLSVSGCFQDDEVALGSYIPKWPQKKTLINFYSCLFL